MRLLHSFKTVVATPHDRMSQQATPERKRSKEVAQKHLSRRFVRLRGGDASQGHALARATKTIVSGQGCALVRAAGNSSFWLKNAAVAFFLKQ